MGIDIRKTSLNEIRINQTHDLLNMRLEVFGSVGHYEKPRITPSGKYRKNNEFKYPHKYEMLNLKRELLDVDKTNDLDVDYICSQVHRFIMRTNEEFYTIRKQSK